MNKIVLDKQWILVNWDRLIKARKLTYTLQKYWKLNKNGDVVEYAKTLFNS